MAIFTAYKSTNMSTGLGVVDSDVTLDALRDVSTDGLEQDWDVGGGKTLHVSLSGTVGDTSYSLGFDTLRLYDGLGNNWQVTGSLLHASGSYYLSGDNFYTSVNIDGMGYANIILDMNTFNITFDDHLTTTSYPSFGAFIMRGADTVNGSTGADTLLGYGGNDIVKGNGGNDKLVGAGGADKLYGYAANDRLEGGDANDLLYGGAGLDTLQGGGGADRFYFDAALSTSTNKDVILDFNRSQGDKIYLDNDIFTKFLGNENTRQLTSANFRNGSGPGDGDDYFYYKASTGELFYDNNGNASGGNTTVVAVIDQNNSLTSHPTSMQASDFFIVG